MYYMKMLLKNERHVVISADLKSIIIESIGFYGLYFALVWTIDFFLLNFDERVIVDWYENTKYTE